MLPAPTRHAIIKRASTRLSDDRARHGEKVIDEGYVGAFARVRLVRAWIGAAAAMVALGYAFAALLDRLLS